MKKFYFLIFILILFPINAFAADIDISIDVVCPKDTLFFGESMICSINVNTEKVINGIHIEYESDEYLKLKNFSIDPSVWSGTADDGAIDLYSDNNHKGNVKIANFEVSASENINKLQNIYFKNINISVGAFDDPLNKNMIYNIDDIYKEVNIAIKDTNNNDNIDDPKTDDNIDDPKTDDNKTNINNNDNNPTTAVDDYIFIVGFVLFTGLIFIKKKNYNIGD